MKQVNLLPLDIRHAEENRKIRHSLIFTVGYALAGIIVIHVLLSLLIRQMEASAAQPMAYQDTPQIVSVRSSIDAIQAEADTFRKQHSNAVRILCRLRSPVGFLVRLGNIVREKVWLTDLKLDYGQKMCELTGRSFNTRLVSEFMLELKKLNSVAGFDLLSMEQKTGQQPAEIEFKLKINLH